MWGECRTWLILWLSCGPAQASRAGMQGLFWRSSLQLPRRMAFHHPQQPTCWTCRLLLSWGWAARWHPGINCLHTQLCLCVGSMASLFQPLL